MKEHGDIGKDSESAKHQRNHSVHSFAWKVLFWVSTDDFIKKNMEGSAIALKRQSKKLILFHIIPLIICNYIKNL